MHIASVVAVNTTCVVIKALRNGYAASNGSSLVDLLHHVVLAADQSVLIDSVDAVLVRDEAGLSRVAITAYLHWIASLAVVQTTSLVDRAGFICDLIVSHPFEGIQMPAAVTAIICCFARD